MTGIDADRHADIEALLQLTRPALPEHVGDGRWEGYAAPVLHADASGQGAAEQDSGLGGASAEDLYQAPEAEADQDEDE